MWRELININGRKVELNLDIAQAKTPSRFNGLAKLGLSVTASLLLANAEAAPPVTSGMVQSNFEFINAWFSEARGCENIHSYAPPGNKRSIVETVLTCQALKLGGYTGEFKMVVTPNYTRAMLQAAAGETTMPSETLWVDELDEKNSIKPYRCWRTKRSSRGCLCWQTRLQNILSKT